MGAIAEDLRKQMRADYQKEYYQNHKEEFRLRCLKYSKSPRGKEMIRKYYLKHRERIIKYNLDRYYRLKQEKGL